MADARDQETVSWDKINLHVNVYNETVKGNFYAVCARNEAIFAHENVQVKGRNCGGV